MPSLYRASWPQHHWLIWMTSALLILLVASPAYSHTEQGIASYYHDRFQGRTTASGDRFDQNALSAAHKTLPFGTIVRVTRIDTGSSVEVEINDRGPFKQGRIIDLSRKAAEELDLLERGLARVRIEVVADSREN